MEHPVKPYFYHILGNTQANEVSRTLLEIPVGTALVVPLEPGVSLFVARVRRVLKKQGLRLKTKKMGQSLKMWAVPRLTSEGIPLHWNIEHQLTHTHNNNGNT